MAIFVIISAGVVISVIGSFSTIRLAQEEQTATNLALQGLAATESIKNQSWVNLTVGNFGLSQTGGVWSFSGTSDLTGKYTRVITISQVYRDTNNNIVQSGGTLDPDTLLIVSRVDWLFSPLRPNTVSLSTYLTNWQQARRIIGEPSPMPSPSPNTCAWYCSGLNYLTGICDTNIPPCINSNGTHQAAGDIYCTGGPSADTCCCRN